MVQKVLVFEPEKCVGCRLCEEWCAVHHFGVVNPAKSCIKITRHHETQVDYGIICHQCVDAPCIAACKFDALSRDPLTDAIIVDKVKCIGCRACIRKCPYAAPSMYPGEKYVIICDLCGGDPQCVSHCPEQAVQYIRRDLADRVYRSVVVNKSAKQQQKEAK
jgi:Fe-S-cluster-containing hydrogenase component 2